MNERRPTQYPLSTQQQWRVAKEQACARFDEGHSAQAVADALPVSYEAVRGLAAQVAARRCRSRLCEETIGRSAAALARAVGTTGASPAGRALGGALADRALDAGAHRGADQETVWCLLSSQPRSPRTAGDELELPKADAPSQRAQRSCHPQMAQRRLATHIKGAQANGATVIFIDETGFSQRPNVRRTYAPRGQTPAFREHFNWKRLSAIGAVAWRPGQATTRLLLSARPGSISTPEVIEFLRNSSPKTSTCSYAKINRALVQPVPA